MNPDRKIAIIGSFKQHYDQVLDAWRYLCDQGFVVTSPKGTPILEPGIEFVRFESDPENLDDPGVQTVALHRILGADAVYVVAPNGYVGRTTCYEVGRIMQARRPLYFSEHPKDLPVLIPANHICDVIEFASRGVANGWQPLYENIADTRFELEKELVNGRFRADL